jgi:protein associated with RNAse G/E
MFVARQLAGIAKEVKMIDLPLDIKVFPHGDITDYFVENSGTKEKLDSLIKDAIIPDIPDWR